MKLWLSAVLLVAATRMSFGNAPLPNSSYLGLAKTIKIDSFNGAEIAGGGSFTGYVSNGATNWQTTFWCIDDQLYFMLGQSGLANVITLKDITPNDPRIRYGDVHNAGVPHWTNTGGGLPDDALSRFRMAAYLITQYDFITASNPQSGLQATTRNSEIQRTIWALTNNSSSVAQNGAATTAFAGTWKDLALANYQTVNLSSWAIVSWTVDSNGVLGAGGYGDIRGARQTFLAQLVTPEPQYYALLGAAISGVVFLRNRRKKRSENAVQS